MPAREAKLNLKQIADRLSQRELSREELRKYVQLIEPLEKFRIRDILIRGIPAPDGIKARFMLDLNQLTDFTRQVGGLKDTALRGWRVFPLGIPVPDIFEVELDLGRPREVAGAGGLGGLARF